MENHHYTTTDSMREHLFLNTELLVGRKMNLNAAEMDNLVPQGFSRNICMVQYAIVQRFNQKLQKTENFYFATIFRGEGPSRDR